jgi:hypothetical protein
MQGPAGARRAQAASTLERWGLQGRAHARRARRTQTRRRGAGEYRSARARRASRGRTAGRAWGAVQASTRPGQGRQRASTAGRASTLGRWGLWARAHAGRAQRTQTRRRGAGECGSARALLASRDGMPARARAVEQASTRRLQALVAVVSARAANIRGLWVLWKDRRVSRVQCIRTHLQAARPRATVCARLDTTKTRVYAGSARKASSRLRWVTRRVAIAKPANIQGRLVKHPVWRAYCARQASMARVQDEETTAKTVLRASTQAR